MADVSVIGVAARNALFALAQAQRTLDNSAERVRSGLRILSPAQGVAAFFDASSLSSRSTRLLSIKDKITDATAITGGTVSTLDSIINTVNQMKAQAQAAAASSVSTTVVGNVVSSAAAIITTTIAGASDNDSFDITHSGTTTTITNASSETFTSLTAQIDAISGLTATVSDGNSLVITAADGNDITITNNVNSLATDLGLSTSTNGSVASSTAIQTAETQFDLLRLQLNTLTGEATRNGVNLISINPDNLTVAFDGNGTTAITISGVASDAVSLGISAVDSANSFSTDSGITASIAELDAALTTLQTTRAGFIAADVTFDTRRNFTKSMINLLNEGATKLTGVNLNEEKALTLATKTRRDLTLSGIQILLNDTALTSLLKTG